MTLNIERARLIAKMVHLDETRRGGEPYYTHCDAVESGVELMCENTKCAAQMHDVLENAKNPDLIRDVLKEYFPPEVSFLVETLTHDKNIYYSRYIDIISNNPKALTIKISDMLDNTKDVNLPEKQALKYKEACLQIMAKGKEIPQILKERLKIENKL